MNGAPEERRADALPEAPASDIEPSRRHRSRKVRLNARRAYRSGQGRAGRVRVSRRRRLKRWAFRLLCVALAAVLGYALWRARRPGVESRPPDVINVLERGAT